MHARQDERYPVVLSGRCAAGGSLSCSAQISNLSASGCEVTGHSTLLQSGTEVSIKLPGKKPIAATVRWNRGQRSGLEFEQALDLDDLDLMVSGQTAQISAEMAKVKRASMGQHVDEAINRKRRRVPLS